LFADVYPGMQQTVRVLLSICKPEALYRRIREDAAGRVEQSCRDVLAALAPSLAASEAVAGHLQVGDRIEGRSEIEQILHPTGQSQVVRARDIHLGTTVAIKFLSPETGTDGTLQDLHLQMPGREGQIIGRLMQKIHPNIGIVLTFLPASHAIVKPWVERSVPSCEAILILILPQPRVSAHCCQMLPVCQGRRWQRRGIAHLSSLSTRQRWTVRLIFSHWVWSSIRH